MFGEYSKFVPPIVTSFNVKKFIKKLLLLLYQNSSSSIIQLLKKALKF